MSALDPIRRVVGAVRRRLDPAAQLAARVRARKAALAAMPQRYTDQPRVSLLVLSFNHRANAQPILDGLRRTVADEIIVCEDGSVDGAEQEWSRLLNRPNEFLLRSNDLHEIRAYNRAVDYARGAYVCVLQDDDIPPDDGRWIRDALDLFAADPQLAVLGGHQGYVLDVSEPLDRIKATDIVGFREGEEWAHVRPIPTRALSLDVPFMYVEGVSVGPIFFRRDVLRSLGGFDTRYSGPGEPGILFDHDACIRAWRAGYRVGLYGPPLFRKYVGGQGTYMFGHAARRRNAVANAKQIRDRWAADLPGINQMTAALNQTLAPRTGDAAPVAKDGRR